MHEPSVRTSQSRWITEIAKIRSLPKGKRWEYIWEYYKLTFFLVAFAVFFLGMIGNFLISGLVNTLYAKDPVSIAFAVTDFSNCEEWMDSCLAAIGYDEKQEDLQVLAAQPYSDTSDTFRINTSVWLVNGQPDIVVVNEASFQYLMELEALADLQEILPAELLPQGSDRMIAIYGVDLTGTAFAKAYGITEEPVYLCINPHGNGYQRALDIVRYILSE